MAHAPTPAEEFHASRPRLRALAYRMLGSHAEADDAVQEAWMRFDRSDTSGVANLGGWLTTVTSRVCLDRLRSRRARGRLEGPPAEAADLQPQAADDDPAEQVLLAESVGAALLAVLERLAPAERVAFVLHDVFAVPFEQVAEVLGRSTDAARQLASRGRRRVRSSPLTPEVDVPRQRAVVRAFHQAARNGDFDALLGMLDPDVVLRPDAAAVRLGALRDVRGAAAVAATLSRGARGTRLAVVGGAAGLAWAPAGEVRGALEFTIVGGRIVAVDAVADPDRLRRLDILLVG